MIDWNKLQPYKTTKQKSFEQLCFEIAVKLYPEMYFTPIDDSGGGDGVEFYVTLNNGSEWGWQAKYYEGSVRLSIGNRKQGIIKSLKRACEVHPNLTKWYLCLPMDFTPDEKTWAKTELITHIPAGRHIDIIPWNETFLHEKINLPKFNGLKQAFFNDLELSQDWFRKTFLNSFSIVKNKFDDLLYTTNEDFEYWYVHPILCDSKFITNRIAYYPRKLEELQKNGLVELKKLSYSNDKWRPFFNEYVKQYSAFNAGIEKIMPTIKSRLELITPNHVLSLREDDFDKNLEYFNSVKPTLDDFRKTWQSEVSGEETEEEKKQTLEEFRRIWPVERVYQEFIDELKYYADHSCIPVRWRVAHYLGNGGAGKTNFCVALTKQYLDADLPVIYLPAIKFTSSAPLTEQILSLLDIKSGYSFTDLLDVLDTLGKIHNKRVPVIIDGLNEAISTQGFLNERFELDLPTIENEIFLRTNVVLLTTCRSSYQKAIWKNIKADDRRFHDMYGFTNPEDKKRLVKNYFDHYKIQSDLSFMSLERFTKPLYLKIYCETVNPTKEQLVQVTLGYDSIYSIFDNFLKHCDQNVYQRLSKRGLVAPTTENKRLASTVLKKIAKHLWENPQRAFLISELIVIADGPAPPTYKDSITKALLDEELLLIRNWQDGEEYVYLTYDIMAGYFISDHLLEIVPDFSNFFIGDNVDLLLGDDYEKLHPNHEDILNGLCSLLPIRKGIFVHDLVGRPSEDHTENQQQLFEKSIATTIMLSPEYIPEKEIAYFGELAEIPRNMIYMFGLSVDVLFITIHPFNFSFWATKLSDLPMNTRDTTWTEYVRMFDEGYLEDIISEFELLQTKPHLTQEQVDKINLVADFLIWTFTSTNNNLKKKSANALYLFAIKFPVIYLTKYYLSAEVNDPSVFEWTSNVLYNVTIYLLKATSGEYQTELIKLSNFISEQVLSANGKHATNHLIIRNYNYTTLSLLVKKVPAVNLNLPTIRKAFNTFGIINWKEAKDRNDKQYRDGNSLIDYHFNKEKMPYIMVGRGNEYNRTPEYKKTQAKLRWRAYQLGYQLELFGEIDKKIANHRHWGEDYKATERYADKYIEIAYLEYCGYLEDRQKLKNYEDYGYLRTFRLKHDPTETGDSENPSLPEERFIVEDYIDSNVSLKAWCRDKSIPNLSGILFTDNFLGKKGNWVLLRGLVHQHKSDVERQFFYIADIVFVKNKNLKAARKAFTGKTELGRGNDSIPNTNHIHESEIPDAEAIPYNEFIKWHYSLESEIIRREYDQVTLSKNGKLLKLKEADALWRDVLTGLNYMPSPRTSISGFSLPMIRFVSSEKDQDEAYEEAFKNLAIELGQRKIIKRERQSIDKTIEVFIPVRYLKQQAYLCKNMIDDLSLSSPANSTDLYDDNDELSSFSYRYEVAFNDEESFVYIRQDLLDKYLKDNGLTMFSIIWGERDYYPIDDEWLNNPKTHSGERGTFYEAIEYKPKG
ncbi:NACHT domain-containing protein [Mucilaginibacter flavidus]|uniref:NACHT domain-containing protein n=1 Tax=Mucilaginibacter flavidus TaxID=2949309 RepID=UPI00209210D8|nr:hypothetical protein [Mucilaginibacter flavidus]MCO5950739.1 hypothetical protein [Mucilaginibacter flavidus]